MPWRKNLTEERKQQLIRLADCVLHTSINIYSLAERELGEKVGEEIFPQLRHVAGVFHCDICSRWLPVAEEVKGVPDVCEDCMDKENGVGEEA